jgi:hypothetical protein
LLDFLKDFGQPGRECIAFHPQDGRFRFKGQDEYPARELGLPIDRLDAMKHINMMRIIVRSWRQVLRSHGLDIRVMSVNMENKEAIAHQHVRAYFLGERPRNGTTDWLREHPVKNIVFKIVRLQS